jgi:hypothetical protein
LKAETFIRVDKFCCNFAAKFKGSLTRHFRLQVFFNESVSPGPRRIKLGHLTFSKIAGVVVTGDKLIADVMESMKIRDKA